MDTPANLTPAPPRRVVRHVLLDRDGTIIVERGYLSDPAGVQLETGAAEGLAMMQRHGRVLIVITNQSGIGRGYFDLAQLDRVHAEMNRQLAGYGIERPRIYYCPHLPTDNCQCRKPAPGMVLRAAADSGFDPRDCVIIGDKQTDVELGRRVGATTILVTTGYGTGGPAAGAAVPDYTAATLLEAAQIIASLEMRESRDG